MKSIKKHVNNYVEATKAYLHAHQRDIKTAMPIVLTAAVLGGIIAFATLHNMPNIVYQPVKACDLLTPTEATTLLGDKIHGVDKNEPVITGDTATSKCSYTDVNPDKMMVAAVAVRSGINDEGVAKNKADFTLAKSNESNEVVTGVGESAYFNKASGQLNVLSDKKWIIISYGVGEQPEANTVEEATKLAKLVLN